MLMVTGLVLLALSASAVAQRLDGQFWPCNPITNASGCPPKPGLAKSSYSIDFTNLAEQPPDWTLSNYATVKYGNDGAEFTFAKRTDSPQLWTNWNILFGRVDVLMKCAPGIGMISSAVLISDVFDEIDWEWSGNNFAQNHGMVQNNYFAKGITGNYDRGMYVDISSPQTTWHTYSYDWSPTALTWLIDGVAVRTFYAKDADTNDHQYPQTPSKLQLGVWDGGDPDQNPGTAFWAGGWTDLTKAPFTMYVKSVKITNTYPAYAYNYTDRTGNWQSIQTIQDPNWNNASSTQGATFTSAASSPNLKPTTAADSSVIASAMASATTVTVAPITSLDAPAPGSATASSLASGTINTIKGSDSSAAAASSGLPPTVSAAPASNGPATTSTYSVPSSSSLTSSSTSVSTSMSAQTSSTASSGLSVSSTTAASSFASSTSSTSQSAPTSSIFVTSAIPTSTGSTLSTSTKTSSPVSTTTLPASSAIKPTTASAPSSGTEATSSSASSISFATSTAATSTAATSATATSTAIASATTTTSSSPPATDPSSKSSSSSSASSYTSVLSSAPSSKPASSSPVSTTSSISRSNSMAPSLSSISPSSAVSLSSTRPAPTSVGVTSISSLAPSQSSAMSSSSASISSAQTSALSSILSAAPTVQTTVTSTQGNQLCEGLSLSPWFKLLNLIPFLNGNYLGFSIQCNIDYPGSDINVQNQPDFNTCLQSCNNYKGSKTCHSCAYHPDTKQCWLKNFDKEVPKATLPRQKTYCGISNSYTSKAGRSRKRGTHVRRHAKDSIHRRR